MENQQYMYSRTFIDNRNSENTTTKRHGHAERKMHGYTVYKCDTRLWIPLTDGHAKNCYTHASVDERQDCKDGEAWLVLQLSSSSARSISICGGALGLKRSTSASSPALPASASAFLGLATALFLFVKPRLDEITNDQVRRELVHA